MGKNHDFQLQKKKRIKKYHMVWQLPHLALGWIILGSKQEAKQKQKQKKKRKKGRGERKRRKGRDP